MYRSKVTEIKIPNTILPDISLSRWNDRHEDPILMLSSKLNVVHPFQLLWRSVFRRVVLEQSSTLRISRRDLQYQPTTLFHHHVRWPNFDVDGVHLSRYDRRFVRREVFAVWVPEGVPRRLLVDLSKTDSQPAFGDWDWVADGTGVQDLFAISSEVSKGDEQVDIARS